MRLTADKLSARRGDDLIFQDIGFGLEKGECLILTGANGSGKTTLLRVLAGFIRPESGTIHFECEGTESGSRLSEASHYLGHRNGMKSELTVEENLNFWRMFFGNSDPSQDGVEAAADRVGLTQLLHLPFSYLSAGQQRRLAFAKLLVAKRPVWLLDEPTAALDDKAETLLVDLINEHAGQGGIVVAATHQPLPLSKAQTLRMTGFSGVEAHS